jgi:hypothetical protein
VLTVPPRLSSWKEIAAYLGVDTKTAQRWEKLRGLPVHRAPGDLRSQVFAVHTEIDNWLQQSGKPAEEPHPEPLHRRRGLRLPLFLIAGVAVAMVGLMVGFFSIRHRPLGGLALRGYDIVGLDQGGSEAWRFTLSAVPASPDPAMRLQRVLRIVKWSAGDPADAVAAIDYEAPASQRSELLCFSNEGKLRWRWKPATDLLDFDGKPFPDTWSIRDFMVIHDRGIGRAFVAIVNDLRWSSAVYEVSRDGKATLRFANHGYVLLMAPVEQTQGILMAVTGINNAAGSPFVAVVRLAGPPSTSPSISPRYGFPNGPKAAALAYVLLPSSEFNKAQGETHPIPTSLDVRGEVVKVEISEPSTARTIYAYEFDTALRPLHARTTSATHALHNLYQHTGLVRHSFNDCPEVNQPQPLRIWNPTEGWKDASIPVAGPAPIN